MPRIKLTVLAVATALLGIPGAVAAADAAAVAECATGTTPFCTSFAYTVNASGTTTPATTAAQPVDLSFDLVNTSGSHTSDQTRWWQTLTFSLGQDKASSPTLTPSASMPDGLLVAGTRAAQTTCVPGTDGSYNATACPAGYGTALIKSTKSVLLFPKTTYGSASFGIIDIRNVRDGDATATVNFLADISVTYDGQTQVFKGLSIAGKASTSGAPALVMTAANQWTLSDGSSADVSLDSLHLAFRGVSDETATGTVATTTISTLPTRCGTSNAGLSATDRAGTTVSHATSLAVTGCPTVTGVTAAANQPPRQVKLTATAAAGVRPVAGYLWIFGDGVTQQTTSPTVTHRYGSSAPRTVVVAAIDSAGAYSKAASISLAGTALGGAQVGLTKLAGTESDATTGKRLNTTVQLYRCPTKATKLADCTWVKSATPKSGAWSFSIPRPKSAVAYLAVTKSSTSRIGGVRYVQARPKSTLTLTAPKKATHGRAFTVKGKVTAPAQAGAKVIIQRLAGKSWKTVATVKLTRKSTYAKAIRLGRGTTYVRAAMAGTAKSLAAVSGPRKISVR